MRQACDTDKRAIRSRERDGAEKRSQVTECEVARLHGRRGRAIRRDSETETRWD